MRERAASNPVGVYIAGKRAAAADALRPFPNLEPSANCQNVLHDTEIETFNDAGGWYDQNMSGGSAKTREWFQVFVVANSVCAAALDLLPTFDYVHNLPYKLEHLDSLFYRAGKLQRDGIRTWPEEAYETAAARMHTERLEEERIDREMHAQVRRGNYNAMVDGRLRATAADRQNMINFYQSRLDDDSNDAETRDFYAKSVAELKKPRTRPPVGWLDS